MFFQSGGTADRHRAADPDEFPGFHVEDFFILEVEDFFPDLHTGVSFQSGYEKGNRAVA